MAALFWRYIHSTATACKHDINQVCDMTWTPTLIECARAAAGLHSIARRTNNGQVNEWQIPSGFIRGQLDDDDDDDMTYVIHQVTTAGRYNYIIMAKVICVTSLTIKHQWMAATSTATILHCVFKAASYMYMNSLNRTGAYMYIAIKTDPKTRSSTAAKLRSI